MLGKPVAKLSLPSIGGSTFSLSGARGIKLVRYFYPPRQHRRLHAAGRAAIYNDMYGRKVRGIEDGAG